MPLLTTFSPLKPMASPFLVNGQLSAAAQRGQQLFSSANVGCATCHPPGLFTDLNHRDVGTMGKFDKPEDQFDTPTLIECWRTAPYLHDGSAATIRAAPTMLITTQARRFTPSLSRQRA